MRHHSHSLTGIRPLRIPFHERDLECVVLRERVRVTLAVFYACPTLDVFSGIYSGAQHYGDLDSLLTVPPALLNPRPN